MEQFSFPKPKNYLLISCICGLIVTIVFFSINYFTPDFMFHFLPSFYDYINGKFLVNFTPWNQARYILFWLNFGISQIFILFSACVGCRWIFVVINDKKGYYDYANSVTQIINSCNPNDFNDKVALLVCVCNDFSPNTLIQTSNQTYKKIDTWILDDSSDQELKKVIDTFAKNHNFFVYRRTNEEKINHKTKIANVKSWVSKLGKKYDYVFETDSSAVVTNSYVENCLCFYHSQLTKNIKIGGVGCNGQFYPAKNFLTKVNSITSSIMSNEVGNQGAKNRSIGTMMAFDGWCLFIKTSVLNDIPLEKVECSACDSARGIWLVKNGYKILFNPYDFSGKIPPQNIQALKNQKVKWTGADYFMLTTKLCKGKFPNKLSSFFAKITNFELTIYILLTICVGIINTVVSLILNVFYFNLSLMFVFIDLTILAFIILWIYCHVKKYNIFNILWYLLWTAIIEGSFMYKRAYQLIVRGLILNTQSTISCVTKKTLYKSSTKEKIRMGLFDSIIILISLIICFTLTFTIGTATQHNSNSNSIFESIGYVNNWVVWFSLFPFLCGPSFAYVTMVWVGEIPNDYGWDPSMTYFPIEKYDFRYNYVMNSEIWIKHHGVGEKTQISEPHTHTHTHTHHS